MEDDVLYELSSALHAYLYYTNNVTKSAVYQFKLLKDSGKLDEDLQKRATAFYEREKDSLLEYLETINSQTQQLLDIYNKHNTEPPKKPKKKKTRKKNEQK